MKKKIEAPEAIEDTTPMNDKKMDALLLSLAGMPHWTALKRFIDKQMITAENALCTLDPFKEPTICARQQGIRMGLYSVVSYLDDLKERSKNKGETEDNSPSYNNF